MYGAGDRMGEVPQRTAMSWTRGLGLMDHRIPGPKGPGWGHCRGGRVSWENTTPGAPGGRAELCSRSHTQGPPSSVEAQCMGS